MTEKDKMTNLIYKSLERKVAIRNTVNNAFEYMKGKLNEKEKRASLNGMNGSLLFKMIQN